MISKKQLKNLRTIKASELVIGGVFYKQESDGSFSRCCIDELDVKSIRAPYLRTMTKEFADKGLLFVRIDAPWVAFER